MRGFGRRFVLIATFIATDVVFLTSNAYADGVLFTKEPYLQGLGSTAVSIRWEGSAPVGGVIVVTGPGGFKREYPTEEKASFHSLEVSGLKPATTYSYTVRVASGTSPAATFTTAPDDTRPFSFLAYGDTRTDVIAHSSVVQAMLRTQSDFLINTGDLVADGVNDNDWASFFHIEAPLLRNRCVFSCVGNHELFNNGASRFLRYFYPGIKQSEPHLYYSIRWSNTRFFFLNATSNDWSEDSNTWLTQQLKTTDEEPGLLHRFVVMHHGLFSSGPHGPNPALEQGGLLSLLQTHHVELLFTGHDHLYERGELGGVHYLLTGGGGAPLYRPRTVFSPATEAFEASHHFVEVHIDGPAITTIAHRVDGSLMETCHVQGNAPWACENSTVQHPPSTAAASSSQGVPPPSALSSVSTLAPPVNTPAKRGCACTVKGITTNPKPSWPLILLLAFGIAPLRRLHCRPKVF